MVGLVHIPNQPDALPRVQEQMEKEWEEIQDTDGIFKVLDKTKISKPNPNKIINTKEDAEGSYVFVDLTTKIVSLKRIDVKGELAFDQEGGEVTKIQKWTSSTGWEE